MQLHKQDAFEFLKSIPSDSVGLVITDPPYESLEKHRSKGTTTRLANSKSSSNNWFKVIRNDQFDDLFAELYRVMKKGSHLYLICDQETMFAIKEKGEQAGFKFWKPLVWDKKAIGMGYHYRCRHEFILFFEKGKRKLKNLSMPDVLEHKRVWRGYPTEKPVSLFADLVSQSGDEGDVFLDPFFGSGASLIAAQAGGMEVIGNDLSQDAHDYLSNRLTSN